ncbi:hypothetical protein HanIR_Chr12g0588841 [Helianthus annuus]|nr:hypothetical protein HanIR_Chr12g0588841 [Helianthus annuus]
MVYINRSKRLCIDANHNPHFTLEKHASFKKQKCPTVAWWFPSLQQTHSAINHMCFHTHLTQFSIGLDYPYQPYIICLLQFQYQRSLFTVVPAAYVGWDTLLFVWFAEIDRCGNIIISSASNLCRFLYPSTSSLLFFTHFLMF